MAFLHENHRGEKRYLHGKAVTLKNGSRHTIYYFSKDVWDKEAVDSLPEGYVVDETDHAIPVLRKPWKTQLRS